MKFRFLCFGSHLLLSLLIALLVVGLVFWLWYPSPLDKALGVSSIFVLLLSIDVIVGPLLTLVVAKQGKKTLKMDLVAIGVIQMLALSYGLYIVAQGRPVWMIYDSGRFELVQAYEAVKNQGGSSEVDNFKLGLSGPVWGAVIESLPASIGKGDAYYNAEFLKKYDEHVAAQVGEKALKLDVLKRFNDPAKVDKALSEYPEANAFVPMAAKNKAIVVLVNTAEGYPIAIVDLSHW